jgi:hypothetical protein
MTRRNPSVTLRGDRNECPGCAEVFNSTAAFDKHRTGKFGKAPEDGGRRCRTVAEMEQIGMAKNAAGFWCTQLMPTDASAMVSGDSGIDFSEELASE